MDAFSYIHYDRLSDDLLYLGNSTLLRFNVTLARVNSKDGTKVSYHKEYKYPSDKYIDADFAMTMRRSFDYYLSIEKVDAKESSVMIRVQDIILLRMRLKEVASWFSNGTFDIIKGDIKIVKRPTPVMIEGLAGNKMIMFEPVVIVWDNTNEQQQGVRMTLSESSTYVDISINNFFGFMYLIDTIDMYGAAQNLVNYLGRPALGTNLTEFQDNRYLMDHTEAVEPSVIKAKERQVPYPNRPKSFFDKMDEL